jgi:glycosyltransferase involved in cell wall biosynthesis
MKVSVVIPTYNRADFVFESVKSVLNQTIKPHEVIVVDNGSTDGTEAKLKPLIKQIVYIKIGPSGRPSVPRNVGIQKATGDIIAFQDDDDLWTPNKIEQQIGCMANPDTIVSYGNAEIITAGGKKTGKKILGAEVAKSGSIFNELAASNFVSTLTVMARRDALLKAGGFNETPGLVEDWELWLRLSRVGRFQYVDKILAYYRRHDSTISSSLDDGYNNYILDVYNTLLHERLTNNEASAIHRNIAGVFRHRAVHPKGPTAILDASQAIYHRILALLFASIG